MYKRLHADELKVETLFDLIWFDLIWLLFKLICLFKTGFLFAELVLQSDEYLLRTAASPIIDFVDEQLVLHQRRRWIFTACRRIVTNTAAATGTAAITATNTWIVVAIQKQRAL